MKVLIATPEAIPFVKTGGLADVTGSLVRELIEMGVDARLVMPLYREVKNKLHLNDTGHRVTVPVGNKKYVSRIFSYNESVFFLECDEFFDRDELYGTSYGDYADNAYRFIFFSMAVLESCKVTGFVPDILHCNDWQTGLIPLYVKTVYRKPFRRTATLMTVHNIGYQGIFPASAMPLTGLGPELFTPEWIEYYGQVNFLKAGIVAADGVNTVSMNYAGEIMTEQYGFGLEGVLKNRARSVTGIINGIDYSIWDPAVDGSIPANYDAANISGKKKCKGYLAKGWSFKDKKAPLACMIGRLSSQKGIDIFLDAADRVFSLGINIVVLGKGEEALHKRLKKVAKRYPENFSLHITYDEALAHRIYAGSDMFLMPSKYEPCGLTQMIAMRYGAVPVARATGGIADTVEDYDHLRGKGTGFLFADYSAPALEECLKRAVCVYTDRTRWEGLVKSCMEADFSWTSSAKKYKALYRTLARKVAR